MNMLSRWVEAKPYVGIFASFAGFTASVLAFLHAISIILGVLGAVFAVGAGYYTWRIKREHWNRIRLHTVTTVVTTTQTDSKKQSN